MAKIKKAMKGGSKVAKGGKKGKGSETDQERLLRLEAERLAEEEARRAREAMRRQMIKDRLAQEDKYSRINRLKILNQWRKLMRLVKVPHPVAHLWRRPYTAPALRPPFPSPACRAAGTHAHRPRFAPRRCRSRICARRSRSSLKTTSARSTARMPSSR